MNTNIEIKQKENPSKQSGRQTKPAINDIKGTEENEND